MRTDRRRWHTLPLDDQAGWDAALDGLPHGLAHTWAWNAAVAASTQDPTLLFVAADGSGRFVCPIAERGSPQELDVYTPLGFGGVVGRGPLTTFITAWSDFVARRGYVAGYLGLHPVLSPASLADGPDAHPAQRVHLLDPGLGPEGLQQRMSASTRRQLRRWADAGLQIGTDRDVLGPAFQRLYPGFMRSRGAGTAYELRPVTLERLWRMPAMRLYGVPADEPAAVVLVGASSGGAEYVFGVAEDDARGHILALLWRATLDLVTGGAKWFNLGGGIRPDDSVAEFKRRLGGRPVPLVSLRQVYDRPRYEALTRAAGTADESGYFPAYRAPRAHPDPGT
jgi:hypothetical protein